MVAVAVAVAMARVPACGLVWVAGVLWSVTAWGWVGRWGGWW
jgi:hypothetical protein